MWAYLIVVLLAGLIGQQAVALPDHSDGQSLSDCMLINVYRFTDRDYLDRSFMGNSNNWHQAGGDTTPYYWSNSSWANLPWSASDNSSNTWSNGTHELKSVNASLVTYIYSTNGAAVRNKTAKWAYIGAFGGFPDRAKPRMLVDGMSLTMPLRPLPKGISIVWSGTKYPVITFEAEPLADAMRYGVPITPEQIIMLPRQGPASWFPSVIEMPLEIDNRAPLLAPSPPSGFGMGNVTSDGGERNIQEEASDQSDLDTQRLFESPERLQTEVAGVKDILKRAEVSQEELSWITSRIDELKSKIAHVDNTSTNATKLAVDTTQINLYLDAVKQQVDETSILNKNRKNGLQEKSDAALGGPGKNLLLHGFSKIAKPHKEDESGVGTDITDAIGTILDYLPEHVEDAATGAAKSTVEHIIKAPKEAPKQKWQKFKATLRKGWNKVEDWGKKVFKSGTSTFKKMWKSHGKSLVKVVRRSWTWLRKSKSLKYIARWAVKLAQWGTHAHLHISPYTEAIAIAWDLADIGQMIYCIVDNTTGDKKPGKFCRGLEDQYLALIPGVKTHEQMRKEDKKAEEGEKKRKGGKGKGQS